MSEIGLSEAIDQLRREISAAMESAKGDPLQFQLGPVEMEFLVQLSGKAGLQGQAKWIVVSIGADAGVEHTQAHKIKLTLTPKHAGQAEVLVKDIPGKRPE